MVKRREYDKINHDDIAIESENLKNSNTSPYIFLQEAILQIINGNHELASEIIQYAEDLSGIYYEAGSIAYNNFRQSIDLLLYMVKNIPDDLILIRDGDLLIKNLPLDTTG